MAATVDLAVSATVREMASADDLSDYVRFRLRGLVDRESAEYEAIYDRGTYAKLTVEVSREMANYVERKCSALRGRGSLGGERFGELRNYRRQDGVVCHGWFVSPDGATIQGAWSMVHRWGQIATVDVTFYREGNRQFGQRALS